MKSTPKPYTVEKILKLRKGQLLLVDPEYQRGRVWTRIQKQFFVDPILRGYHVPLIYLHMKRGEVIGGLQAGDRLYIVDGQQRIQALYEFSEGAFPLLDPKDHPGRFPQSLVEAPCAWAGRDVHRLNDQTYGRFFGANLSVVEIETNDENEVRDLFIRLQGGKPLTPQEQRDAWPGKFGDFVYRVGGKEGIAKYPGQDFFRKLLRSNVRAKTPMGRQLAAQMVMLFATHREDGGFCDINRKAVDSYYIKHMEFDGSSRIAKDFITALVTVTELLSDGKRPLLVGHQAIHLVLLASRLLDNQYMPESWQPKFADAFDHFTKRLAQARANERANQTQGEDFEYMRQYAYKARAGSDRAHSIRDRHFFFCAKMLEYVQPKVRDPRRVLGPLEREVVYWQNEKKCGVCSKEVVWNEAEFHHIDPHTKGGPTTISNASLVHRSCHPHGDEEVRQFARHIKEKQGVLKKREQLMELVRPEKKEALDEIIAWFEKEFVGRVGKSKRAREEFVKQLCESFHPLP